MNKHNIIGMVFNGTARKMSRPHGRFKSGTGVWFLRWKCPTCGVVAHRLRNLFAGKIEEVVCDGKTQACVMKRK